MGKQLPWLLLGIVFTLAAQSPLQSLDAKVASVRFFGHSTATQPQDQRRYRSRFGQSGARFVSWELDLEHSPQARRVPLNVRSLWYRNGNKIVARRALATAVEPGTERSSHVQGWDHGGRWETGSYRVELYVGTEQVASGAFEIAEPSAAESYVAQGLDHLHKGDTDAAIAAFTRALEEADEVDALGDVYNGRGSAYYLQRRYDAAIEDFTRALGIDSKVAAVYNNRGAAHSAKAEYDLAIADFDRALEIDPTLAGARDFREAALIRSGQRDEEIASTLDEWFPRKLDEPWQKSWDEFANEVERLLRNNAQPADFAARFNGKAVRWEGKVIDVAPGDPPRATLQMPVRRFKLPDGSEAIMDSVTLPVTGGGFSVASDGTNGFSASIGRGDPLVPAAVSYWRIEDAKPGAPQGRIVIQLERGRIE